VTACVSVLSRSVVPRPQLGALGATVQRSAINRSKSIVTVSPVCSAAISTNGSLSSITSDTLSGVEKVLVWFKHDLRVDDHAGLHSICQSKASQLVCLYIIDPQLLQPLLLTPAGPEVLAASLASLQADLRARGNELVVRVGPTHSTLQQAVAECGAQAVVSEHEVETSWAHALSHARDSLTGKSDPNAPKFITWASTAWCTSNFHTNYRTWKVTRGEALPPLPAPDALPAPPSSLTSGHLPTAAELRTLLEQHQQQHSRALGSAVQQVQAQVRTWAHTGPEASRLARLAACGASPTTLLQAYLTARTLPSSVTDSASAVRPLLTEAVGACESEAAPGASFTALITPWLALGALSRRRVLQDSVLLRKSEISLVPALDAAERGSETADFHFQLSALAGQQQRPADAPGMTIKQWRWRGMLSEFCVAEPSEPREGAPAILLVHGFGAFGDQWRGNLGALAAAGYRVFAPTLPGYGRSEKAAALYSQDLWRDHLRDFVLQQVGGPVVVAGNSIGGFIGASLAADCPDLVRGVALLNSAGPVDAAFTLEGWQRAIAAKKPPPKLLVQLLSRSLFLYLELSIGRTLQWLYPTNPVRADKWLGDEIYRAACDPGALEVFQSVFYLPPPRALNHLVHDQYRGPAAVIQGVLDPLNDARTRAASLQATCPGIYTALIQAGHCPHDEQPGKVNAALLSFIEERVLGSSSSSSRVKVEVEEEEAVVNVSA